MAMSEEYRSHRNEHLVHLYEADEGPLLEAVGQYLSDGLRNHRSAVVVASPAHTQALLEHLRQQDVDLDAALTSERLALFDAAAMLARFMVDGRVDAQRFDECIGIMIRRALECSDGPGVRVYGEMVGELWRARQLSAALELERLWNKLRDSLDFDLYCSYPIDVFDDQFDVNALDELLCAHTRLVPAGTDGQLETAVTRAMRNVLGDSAKQLRPLIKDRHRHAWAAMPRGAATLVWLRHNLPEHREEILTLARIYYG